MKIISLQVMIEPPKVMCSIETCIVLKLNEEPINKGWIGFHQCWLLLCFFITTSSKYLSFFSKELTKVDFRKKNILKELASF
jgi:hypothetical protein